MINYDSMTIIMISLIQILSRDIVNKIKYLGILIDDKKKCFESHKIQMNEKIIKLTNQIYAILGNSCNRILIGKTFYKGLVLPSILYANEIITLNDTEIEALQKHDNKTCRYSF